MPYKAQDGVVTPSDSTVLWRYMSFPKLLSVLVSRSLAFPRISKLRDQDSHEGMFPSANRQMDRIDWGSHIAKDSQPALFAKIQEGLSRLENANVFVSCWHAFPDESALMWKVYGGAACGVSVKTTVGRLKKSLSVSDFNVMIGSVDYEGGDIIKFTSPYEVYLRKRAPYSSEREVRALVHLEEGENRQVLPISIDVEQLIVTLFVARECDDWEEEVIRNTVKRFGYNFPILRSTL